MALACPTPAMMMQSRSPGTLDPLSVAMLQDTVEQFEKVMGLERNLLCKSILKLKNDLEETETNVGMKEEELMVWEEKLQQIQQDNEVKLRLAKARTDSMKWRHKSEGRQLTSKCNASPLGFIAEGNEDSCEEDGEEADEEDDADAMSPRGAQCGAGTRGELASQHLAAAESINKLSAMVVAELSALNADYQKLLETHRAAASGHCQQHNDHRHHASASAKQSHMTFGESHMLTAPGGSRATGFVNMPTRVGGTSCASPQISRQLGGLSHAQNLQRPQTFSQVARTHGSLRRRN